MKRYLCLLCISLSCAADPFYAEPPSPEATTIDEIRPQKTACNPTEQVEKVHFPVDFSQLRLVGIIEIDHQFKALFLDEKKNLIPFKENDYLPESGIQFTEINFKQINIIDWQKNGNCQSPHIIQLTL